MASATQTPRRSAAPRVRSTAQPAATKQKDLHLQHAFDAIARSQAVVEFDMDGTVLTANNIFLRLTGYRLDEVVGRHHRMFVGPSEAHGAESTALWMALNRGETRTATFHRMGKGEAECWM